MHSMATGYASAASSDRTLTPSERCVIRFQAACQEAGLSVSTMRRLVRAGRGPRLLQLSDRCIGVRRADLDAWLAGREAKPS